MRIVFDVDNTICVHTNRDYVNASPVYPMIDKINKLHGQGVEIWLYTSRGQNSCNGDLALIIERNEAILVDWLERHGVCYDKLLFGKPLADFYVDDGSLSIQEFLQSDFEELDGNSNSKIVRLGNIVAKTTHNARYQYDWYNDFEKLGIRSAFVPKNRLLTLNTLKMQYVPGTLGYKITNSALLYKLFAVILEFSNRASTMPFTACNFDGYLESCAKCYSSDSYDKVLAMLSKMKDVIVSNISFCHGDLSLSNVIVSDDWQITLIDPNERECSSWLFDLAKLRCSYNGLEKILGYSDTKEFDVKRFDCAVEEFFGLDIEVVKLLEITRFARIIPYMQKMGKIESEIMLKEKVEELCAKMVV